MKKSIAALIAVVMVLAAVLTLAVACDTTTKVVKSLDFVNPQKSYKVGDEIDYDSWKVKITYSDNTTEEKTVKQLVADGATLTKADLSKEGNPIVYLTYKEVTARVTLTVTAEGGEEPEEKAQVVAFSAPGFYTTYVTNSSNRASGATEERRDFRITGAPYEVGTANKFLFKPIVTSLDDNDDRVDDPAPKTTVKVYAKDSVGGTYSELTGQTLENFVTIGDNAYKFAGGSDDKYVKLEISLDANKYDLTALSTAAQTISIEFVLVEDGYNVYDQIGLSVMADLEKKAWSEIWDCNYEVVGNEVKLTAKADNVPLLADDKPICEYVDKVSTVILHNEIVLDADLMPSLYFWTSTPGLVTSDNFDIAQNSLGSDFTTAKANLVGTLRSGNNSGVTDDQNYMRVIDTEEVAVEGKDYKINGGTAIELGFGLNMQRSIFATKHVNVSGNYQTIKVPDKGTRSKNLNRALEMYVDWDTTAVSDPLSHWAVFQTLQSRLAGAPKADFEIRNIAMEGNNPTNKESDEQGFTSAGLMLNDSYTTSLTFNNVNASQFFNMMNGDDYGEIKFKDGKVNFDEGEPEEAIINIYGTKLYNAYSNMMYLWRSTAEITNSEMIGSGGPLFIACDGPHTVGQSADTDVGGPEIRTDSISKLEAHAYGGESWYATWKVQALFGILGNIEALLRDVGKTIYVSNQGEYHYINVISAMICEPGSLLTGGSANSKDSMFDIRGTFTEKDYTGETPAVKNAFAMHNQLLMGIRIDKDFDAKQFPPIIQIGEIYVLYVPAGSLGVGNPPIDLLLNPLTMQPLSNEEKQAIGASQNTKICVYMSAATTELGTTYSPYFGVVLDVKNVEA